MVRRDGSAWDSRDMVDLAHRELVAASGAIGKIRSLSGSVTVVGADGMAAQVDVGNPIFQGDLIETGVDGRVGLMFNDGTTFNLSASARLRLDAIVRNPDGALNSTLVSLSQGT